MSEQSFSELDYAAKKHKTRGEKFLERIELLIPWKQLTRQMQKQYPKTGNGRRPYPLEVMLRVHCVQPFHNLSDPMMEDTFYEVDSIRRFCGLSLSGAIPDESTILKFRHLLEDHDLGTKLFKLHVQSTVVLSADSGARKVAADSCRAVGRSRHGR